MKTYEAQSDRGDCWIPITRNGPKLEECHTIDDAYTRACTISLRDKVTTRVIEHWQNRSRVRLVIEVPTGGDALL